MISLPSQPPPSSPETPYHTTCGLIMAFTVFLLSLEMHPSDPLRQQTRLLPDSLTRAYTGRFLFWRISGLLFMNLGFFMVHIYWSNVCQLSVLYIERHVPFNNPAIINRKLRQLLVNDWPTYGSIIGHRLSISLGLWKQILSIFLLDLLRDFSGPIGLAYLSKTMETLLVWQW